jgi:hypothetical protein
VHAIGPELAGLLVQKGISTNESELMSKSQQKARKGVNFILERVEKLSMIFFGV